MRAAQEDRGQIIVMLAVGLLILILFVGLAVDGGMAYITKAKLSKAVDAACLTGMKALPQGQDTATTLATHIFNANYGPNPPIPTITFPTDGYGDQQVSVTASANVPTFFAQHFFQFWHVSDTATATRGKLVMSLVLDRSGSMNGNGGGTALKAAVPPFVNDWDDSRDDLAMVSYASNARVDFHMSTNFQSPINTAVAGLSFTGGTFGTGGTYVASVGPPLALADNEIGTIPILTGQNVTRVAIYFTDGQMNEIQDTLSCNGTPTLYNIGGYDISSDPNVGFFNPTTGAQIYRYDGVSTWYTCDVSGNCNTMTATSCLRTVAGFLSAQSGTIKPFTRSNVTNESQYRALQTANAMGSENPGVFLYVVGLGSGVNSTTQAFLRQIANDPASSTYNPSLPVGEFWYVQDCPGPNCTQELTTVFQTIAAKILLRLTQ